MNQYGNQITEDELIQGFKAMAAQRTTSKRIGEVVVEEKFPLGAAIIIGVVRDKQTGLAERTPTIAQGFESLQSNYITIEIGRASGFNVKTYKVAVFENRAPGLFKLLQENIKKMEAEGGEWTNIVWEAAPLVVMDMIFDRNFFISDGKGGWSKDKKGNPVLHNVREFLYMPDIDTLQTLARREIRNLEYSGAFGGNATNMPTPQVTGAAAEPAQGAAPAATGNGV